MTQETDLRVSISPGNIKMGNIASVSLPPYLTCPDAPCKGLCYAGKIDRLRKAVHNAYARNYNILQNDPSEYWRQVGAAIMGNRYFRFHISGDIPNREYFQHMMALARRNRHCKILCFTKRYNIINEILQEGYVIPENLKVIFSVWRDYECDNPYNLPEAHVKYKDGTETARPDAHDCGGNCYTCATSDGGCWKLGKGEQIVFKQH